MACAAAFSCPCLLQRCSLLTALLRVPNRSRAAIHPAVSVVSHLSRAAICQRVNRGTYSLKEWIQVSLNATGLVGNGTQDAVEVDHKLPLRGVVSVVCGLNAHVVPKGFGRVELGAVLG